MSLSLIIDTALNACAVGLFERIKGRSELNCLYENTALMSRGHQEFIGPQVYECFQKTGIKPDALDRVGVTLGPGSFTGLRVGLSFAKGLAAGAGVPLKGFSTLEALAAHEEIVTLFKVVVIEAGRGQVYVQAFDGMAGLHEPKALNINDEPALSAYAQIYGKAELLTGTGLDHLRPYWPEATAIPRISPSLRAMAGLSFDESGHDNVQPVYIREPDAKISDKRIVSFPNP